MISQSVRFHRFDNEESLLRNKSHLSALTALVLDTMVTEKHVSTPHTTLMFTISNTYNHDRMYVFETFDLSIDTSISMVM